MPIKFAGVSEKIDGLEAFDGERHAGRVLGMGDIVALVEEVTKGVDLESAKAMADKLKSGDAFTLDDFLLQLQQMKKMGGLSNLMDKLPSQLAGQGGEPRPGRYGSRRTRYAPHDRHHPLDDAAGAPQARAA